MRVRDLALIAALELAVVLLFSISLALLDLKGWVQGSFGIAVAVFSLVFWALVVGVTVSLVVDRKGPRGRRPWWRHLFG